MVYMILPMPKEGSMTLGTTSSTAGDTSGEKLSYIAPQRRPEVFSLE